MNGAREGEVIYCALLTEKYYHYVTLVPKSRMAEQIKISIDELVEEGNIILAEVKLKQYLGWQQCDAVSLPDLACPIPEVLQRRISLRLVSNQSHVTGISLPIFSYGVSNKEILRNKEELPLMAINIF